MRKFYYLITLLLLSVHLFSQEKKKFPATFDITTNIHIGTISVAKENWARLFKNGLSAYTLDTFYDAQSDRAGFNPPASLTARISGSLFGKSQQRLVKDRFEWRAGLLFSPKVKSTSYFHQVQALYSSFFPLYTHNLSLTYQRSWLDLNGYVVYKIPSFLLKKYLRYHIGTGLGFTGEVNGKITENRVGYTRTPPTMSLTEDYNTTRTVKAKSIVSPYWGLTGATEIIFSKDISVLLEATYQGYLGSWGLNKRMYEDGGYLSLAFRYKF